MKALKNYSLYINGVVVFAMAVLVRLIGIDQAPGDNEIFHILAARSWMEDGSFSVGQHLWFLG